MVYRHLLDNPEDVTKFYHFIKSNLLFPAISDIVFLELSPKSKHREELNTLLPGINSILLKKSNQIIEEEVNNYPNGIDTSIIDENGYLIALLFKKEIEKKLASSQTRKDWKTFRSFSSQMESKLTSVMKGYPTSSSGKYSRDQAYDFSKLIVMKWLSGEHPRFILPHLKKKNEFKPEGIQSIQLFANYVFYKYYNGRRTPKKLSEFGDLFHLFYLPFCKQAVLERDMCSILLNIQKEENLLQGVTIHNIDFFKTL